MPKEDFEPRRDMELLPRLGTELIHDWPVVPMLAAVLVGWDWLGWFCMGIVVTLLFNSLRVSSHRAGTYRFTDPNR